jgi:transposase
LEYFDLHCRVAAQRCDRIDAPWILEDPINGEAFKTNVEKVLAPTLRPGDLVIIDNLGSHNGKAVRDAIGTAGARLILLPKCSPDLNPIKRSSPSPNISYARPPHARSKP